MAAPAHSATGAIGPHTLLEVAPDGVQPFTPVRHRAARAFPWLGVTVAATAAAGGLHLAAAATHGSSGDLVVGFFGLTGFVQLATAAAVFVVLTGAQRRQEPRGAIGNALVLLAAAMTVGLLCLYVVVHGTDLLAGPLESSAAGAAGAVEHSGTHLGTSSNAVATGARHPVDALGTTTVGVELLALTGSLALLPAVIRRRATDVLLLIGVLGWALWLTGALD
jgi:hypothetical protein